MTYEFDGGKNADLRDAVARRVAAGERVRLNTRRGMGGGLNVQEFPFRAYRKTTPTFAARMADRFTVETVEGTMTGKAGDYLAIGAHGEMYPIGRGGVRRHLRGGAVNNGVRRRQARQAARLERMGPPDRRILRDMIRRLARQSAAPRRVRRAQRQ